MSDDTYCPGCFRIPCQCKQLNADLGLGPDAPVTTNAQGGQQSQTPYRCDLLPGRAILAVARVLKHGAERYAPDNWRRVPRCDHINHALAHIFAHGTGDGSDDHLEHAACRLLMALETA